MNPVVIIEKPSDLEFLAQKLEKCSHIAIDTESNSFHAYYERLCLIQISAEGEDYVIDPLALNGLNPLAGIFADPLIEKIFHAASNDVLGLKRDYRFKIRNIFDTSVASKLLGHKELGLSKILESHFGVHLNKKWQRCNWAKRPLSREQLDYARFDTHYLIALRHELAAGLVVQDMWKTAEDAFAKICEQEAQEKEFRPGAYLHINGARSLDAAGRSVLKALFLHREHEARRRNLAPFRIMSNDTLLRLARHRPTNFDDIAKIKGLPRSYRNSSSANVLLQLIRNTGGMDSSKPEPVCRP